MSWPPPPPDRPTVERRPWDPRIEADPALPHDGDKLLYIVVDEMIEGWIGLSVSAWPDADSKGRLRFVRPRSRPLEIGTTREALRDFLSQAAAEQEVEIRIGTTFAARLEQGKSDQFLHQWVGRPEDDLAELSELRNWLRAPRDITEQARHIAKLAYYGAVLSTLPQELERQWNLQEEG